MFLEHRAADYSGQDEWVLGFHLPRYDQFLFYHEGLQLAELPDGINLSILGSAFYLIQAGRPFTLAEAVADPAVFAAHYGVTPPVVMDQYLAFDAGSLEEFFRATAGDWSLECMIVGTHEKDLSREDLATIVQAVGGGQGLDLAELRLSSLLATHDNSFFYVEAKPHALLLRLLSESVAGFFHQLHPHPYAPVSAALLNVLLSEYHTTQLECWPTVWDEHQNELVPADVQVDAESVQALLKTGDRAWNVYQPKIPSGLQGRGLLLSYSFPRESWSFEKWP